VIAGVDGAAPGWVAVLCDDDLGRPPARFVKKLRELPHSLRVVAVDVPRPGRCKSQKAYSNQTCLFFF